MEVASFSQICQNANFVLSTRISKEIEYFPTSIPRYLSHLDAEHAIFRRSSRNPWCKFNRVRIATCCNGVPCYNRKSRFKSQVFPMYLHISNLQDSLRRDSGSRSRNRDSFPIQTSRYTSRRDVVEKKEKKKRRSWRISHSPPPKRVVCSIRVGDS